MRRRAGIVVGLAGACAAVASLFLPIDFAWSGINTFDSCVSTSRYASGTGARLAWLGFAAAVLYQYVWAAASGVAFALEWRRPSRLATRIAVAPTALGGLLVLTLGVSLLAMREAWPAQQIQLAAAVLPLVHVSLLAFAVRRAAPGRKTPAAVLVGGIPFVAVNAGLGIASFRYDSPAWGFAIAGIGVTAMLAASCLFLFWRPPPCEVSNSNV